MLNEPLEVTQARAQGIDLGLQAFMQNVFRKMGLGLVLTGITAYLKGGGTLEKGQGSLSHVEEDG